MWTREFEDSLARGEPGDVYPGMMFSLAKGRMEGTRLWSIVQRMPKGALLHAHMDAMVDVDWLLDQALSTPGMHFYASEPLTTPKALKCATALFVYSPSSPQQSTNVWDAQYTPSTRVPAARAAESFPDGGRKGFVAWLKDRCTITAGESLAHQDGPNAIWQKFASTFVILGSVIFYEPIFRASVRRILQECLADGVRWIDLRAAFVFEYRRQGSETPEDGYLEVIRVLGEEIDKFKGSDEGRRFWGARMIWTSLRIYGKRQIIESA